MKQHSRRRKAAFSVIILLCVYLAAESGMLMIHRANERRARAEYAAAAAESAAGFADMFGQLLRSYTQSVNALFMQNWFGHLRNFVGYYDSEFDSITRAEISSIVSHTAASMSYVYDLILIIPGCDAVICKNGWFTQKDYERIYGDISISVTNPGTKELAFAGENPLIVVPDSSIRKYHAYAALVLNGDAMRKSLCALLNDSTPYVDAELCGRTLFTSGERSDALLYFTASYQYPELYLTFGCLPANLEAGRLTFLLFSALLLPVMALIEYVYMRITARPVRRLILENGGSKSDVNAPYEYVSRYIDSLRQSEKRLLNEKREREDELERFLKRARADIAVGMVTSHCFRFDDPDVLTALPWLNDGMDMCLFCLPNARGEIADIWKADMLDGIREAVLFRTDMGCLALVWLKDGMLPEEKREYALLLRHRWSILNGSICFMSALFKSAFGIRDVYGELGREIARGLSISSALSGEERTRVTELVQSSDAEAAVACAERLLDYYEPNDLLNVAYAAAEEEPKADLNRAEALSELARLCEVCGRGRVPEEAQQYLDYIDSHFSDPDLSVTVLSDVFDRHRTLISKGVKAASGLTFTDYLRSARIREALRRIDSGNPNIMQIATDVGYVSYSTFKRAFQQTQGMTPTEYREQKMSVK